MKEVPYLRIKQTAIDLRDSYEGNKTSVAVDHEDAWEIGLNFFRQSEHMIERGYQRVPEDCVVVNRNWLKSILPEGFDMSGIDANWRA